MSDGKAEMTRYILLCALAVSGCGKLGQVGRAPDFTGLEGSGQHYAIYSATLPDDVAAAAPSDASSLWTGGTESLFGDRRAAGRGDILTVVIEIDDSASISNTTGRNRNGAQKSGLPELFGEQIPTAKLVANPGCYPTSAILPLAPLLKAGWVEPSDIIIDSKSGVSGAGRTPKLNTLYPECNESISAYGVGKHRHQPEIEQILGRSSGQVVDVIFTPHLVPMDRGILTVSYSRPTRGITADEVLKLLREFYAGQPFIIQFCGNNRLDSLFFFANCLV